MACNRCEWSVYCHYRRSRVSRGDRVELRGFGAFSVKHRPARAGRNPRTGAHVPVDQKSVPFFKTGKEMRERLNREGGAGAADNGA